MGILNAKMMQRWNSLSGAAKLSGGLAAFLALQLLVFAFPLTRIVVGSMIPVDPFHPWALQLLLILLTLSLLVISSLAWSIQMWNKRNENRATSIRID